MTLKGKSIISAKEIDKKDIMRLFDVADEMEPRKRIDILRDNILATLFFEPSTRTRLSFESAMLRLGGAVIGFADPKVSRAGDWRAETLEDTIRVIQNYSDIIAIRHFKPGAARLVAECADIPIINAGDGSNEHPTQALLDLYTIQKVKGTIDGLKVALVGDLKYERTLHSMAYGLAKFDVEIELVSPKELGLREDIENYLIENGIQYKKRETLKDVISDIDVLYTDTFPKEKYEDPSLFEKYAPHYRFDLKSLENVKEDFIILHPMPRTDELGFQIPPEVDNTPYAKYFDEVANGLRIRMALLALVQGAIS